LAQDLSIESIVTDVQIGKIISTKFVVNADCIATRYMDNDTFTAMSGRYGSLKQKLNRTPLTFAFNDWSIRTGSLGIQSKAKNTFSCVRVKYSKLISEVIWKSIKPLATELHNELQQMGTFKATKASL
jgi:hypothetical protein